MEYPIGFRKHMLFNRKVLENVCYRTAVVTRKEPKTHFQIGDGITKCISCWV